MIKLQKKMNDVSLALTERRAFMDLPLDERRRQLADQASLMVKHYEKRTEVTERQEWQGGDIVECS